MPIYHYGCESCGEFTELRKISECKLPVACPSCGQSASRIIKAPSLNTMKGTERIAHQHNERSAHEPRVVRKTNKEIHTHSHVGHSHSKAPSRPWMIGH